jgi:hypothetical protein
LTARKRIIILRRFLRAVGAVCLARHDFGKRGDSAMLEEIRKITLEGS